MDPVRKVSNIKEFANEPLVLANKLVDVEKSKEGVFDVEIVNAYETEIKPIQISNDNTIAPPTVAISPSPSYIIEYKVDSSRGRNHYLVKSVIRDKKLLVATVQCKEDDYEKLSQEAKSIIDSVQLILKI